MSQNLKGFLLSVVIIFIGFILMNYWGDKVSENSHTCIWCKYKILEKPEQFDHWYLHDSCYGEVDWWSRFVLWYLKGRPLNECSEESREMMKKLIEWRIEAESDAKYLLERAIGEECEKKMAEEWK